MLIWLLKLKMCHAKQTVLIAYFSSKQLTLFACVRQNIDKQCTNFNPCSAGTLYIYTASSLVEPNKFSLKVTKLFQKE